MSSSSRTNPMEQVAASRRSAGGWTGAARNPWTVLCAVATVILGPAAVTASALDQANRAPMHHAVRADQAQQAYIPSDLTRRRATVA